MIATRIFRLLLVALSILAAAEALNPRQGLAAGIRGALNIRQGGTNANTNTDTTTSETSQKATTANTTPTDTTATTTAPTTTHTQETTSSTPTSTQTTPTNTQTKTTPTNTQTQTTPTQTQTNASPTTPTSNGNGNAQTTSSTTSQAAQITPTTSTAIIVITTTNSNGVSMTVTSSSISTGMATLSASSDNSDNQGMSSQTRNTIIGVVVGVGGAIILAVVGLIWWRVWGRKKDSEENDGLMGYGGYTAGAAEKPESLAGAHSGTMGSGSSRTPFQSTLESYHAPTQVNHASNF